MIKLILLVLFFVLLYLVIWLRRFLEMRGHITDYWNDKINK